MQRRDVFLLSLGALLLFVQPMPFLNDEVGQAAALTHLADGELLNHRDGLGPGYDPYLDTPFVQRYLIPGGDAEPRANHGSSMTNILALPILHVLGLLGAVLGPTGAVAVPVSVGAGVGLWAWRRNRAEAWGLGLSLFIGALWMQTQLRPPASPYLEMAALQMLNIVMHAFAVTLIYDFLRNRVERPGLGAFLYAASPAVFWALNLKYHGMAISLAAIVLWLYQDGHRTGPLRTGLAFAVAGLAVWNHLPNGGLVLASLGLMALPAVLLGLRGLAVRAGAGLMGLAVGLIPDWLDRWAHARIDVPDRFIQVGPTVGGEGGVGGVVDQVARQNEGGRLQWAAWNDPAGAWDAVVQVLIWPDRWTLDVGFALPLLVLAPLLILLPWAFRRRGRVPLVWLALHAMLMVVLFGRGMLRNGSAFDFRHTTTIWPFLALPLAVLLDRAGTTGRQLLHAHGWMLLAWTTLVWTPLLLIRGLTRSYQFSGGAFEYVDPFRYLGLALLAPLLALWAWPRLRGWRPHIAAACVAWTTLLMLVIQLGPARGVPAGTAWPFVAWPTAILEELVVWYLH